MCLVVAGLVGCVKSSQIRTMLIADDLDDPET